MKYNIIGIFRKNKTFLSSLLFYLVLSSWYVLRPLRNELAVESYGEGMLIPLLISTTLVMILVNPIYSWVASRGNYIRIIFYTYSFFIFNLADAFISIGAAIFIIAELQKYLSSKEL